MSFVEKRMIQKSSKISQTQKPNTIFSVLIDSRFLYYIEKPELSIKATFPKLLRLVDARLCTGKMKEVTSILNCAG